MNQTPRYRIELLDLATGDYEVVKVTTSLAEAEAAERLDRGFIYFQIG